MALPKAWSHGPKSNDFYGCTIEPALTICWPTDKAQFAANNLVFYSAKKKKKKTTIQLHPEGDGV